MHQWAVPHIPQPPKSKLCAKPPNCPSSKQSLSATVESNCSSHPTPSSCSKSAELNPTAGRSVPLALRIPHHAARITTHYSQFLRGIHDAEVGLCSLTCRSYGNASRMNTAASAPTIKSPASV